MSCILFLCVYVCVHLGAGSKDVSDEYLETRPGSCSIDSGDRPFLERFDALPPQSIPCPGKISSDAFSQDGFWKAKLNATVAASDAPPALVLNLITNATAETVVCALESVAVYSTGASPLLRLVFDDCTVGSMVGKIGVTLGLRQSSEQDSKIVKWMCSVGAVASACSMPDPTSTRTTTTTTTTHEEGTADVHLSSRFESVHPDSVQSSESSFCSLDGEVPLDMEDDRYWFEGETKDACFKRCMLMFPTSKPCYGFASPAHRPHKGCYLHMNNFSQATGANPANMQWPNTSRRKGLKTISDWMCYRLVQNNHDESIVTHDHTAGSSTERVSITDDITDGGEFLKEPPVSVDLCSGDSFFSDYESIQIVRARGPSSSMYWLRPLDANMSLLTVPVSASDWKVLFDDRCPLPEEPVAPCDCAERTWSYHSHHPPQPIGTMPQPRSLDCDCASLTNFNHMLLAVSIVELLIIIAGAVAWCYNRYTRVRVQEYRYKRVPILNGKEVSERAVTIDEIDGLGQHDRHEPVYKADPECSQCTIQ